MLKFEIFVIELLPVYALSSCAIEPSEVTSLAPRDICYREANEENMGCLHEVRDDSVELAALVGERLPAASRPLLPRAQSPEVLGSSGHLAYAASVTRQAYVVGIITMLEASVISMRPTGWSSMATSKKTTGASPPSRLAQGGEVTESGPSAGSSFDLDAPIAEQRKTQGI